MSAGEKLLKLARSVSRRSLGELHERGWQEISKRVDLVRARTGFAPAQSRQRSDSPRRSSFYFSPSELPAILKGLHERFPVQTAEILRQADTICRHRFDLLGYVDLDYGREVDWHLDAISGKRAPRKPWYEIRYLEYSEVGDSKVTWELNRHQHMVTLAKAFRLTNNPRYASEIIALWKSWQKENPYPLGINWSSSLEVAFRSLSWLWVRELLAGTSALPESIVAELRQSLAVNARHIEKYLSTYFSPNTHLLGEGVALFFIGTLCPELAAAPRWRRKGWDIVTEAARRQVRADGMHFEQSTYYHVYALDFFLHTRILAAQFMEIPPSFDNTIVKMLEFLASLGQAAAPPRLGDDDGGRLFDPRRNGSEHLLDPLSTGAVLFHRADFKAVVGSLCEETLWLLGPEAPEIFDQLGASLKPAISRHFPTSGIYVLASVSPEPQQLTLDAGPHGAGSGGHGHADALSLHFAAGGREWISDPGTGKYTDAGLERDLFRGTAAHNTLRVDRLDQAEPAGPFKWRHVGDTRADRWVTAGSFDFLAAHHTGYSRLEQPAVHRRWVFHLKPGFWFVRDCVEGAGNHELELRWHLGPEIHAEQRPNAFLLRDPKGRSMTLAPVNDPLWAAKLETYWLSPAYGQKIPGEAICFSRRASLPADFAALLLSDTEETADGQLDHFAPSSGGDARGAYCCRIGSETHRLFFCVNGKAWHDGEWRSDAEFLYSAFAPDGKLIRAILVGGTFLEYKGKEVFKSGEWRESWEWQACTETDLPSGGNPHSASRTANRGKTN